MNCALFVYHLFGIIILGLAFLGGVFLRTKRWPEATLGLALSFLFLLFLDTVPFEKEQRMFVTGFHSFLFLAFALAGAGLGALVRFIGAQWEDRR